MQCKRICKRDFRDEEYEYFFCVCVLLINLCTSSVRYDLETGCSSSVLYSICDLYIVRHGEALESSKSARVLGVCSVRLSAGMHNSWIFEEPDFLPVR